MGELGLADAIRDLRREIERAMARADGELLQFVLGPVELELQVQHSSGKSGKAGLQWVVVSVDGETTRERSQTHTIKLTLTPRFAGGDVQVAATSLSRPD